MDAKFNEIMLGETVCAQLKIIYNAPWIDCYGAIARRFTQIKKDMRKFYPDKTDLEILQILQNYSLADLTDIGTEAKCAVDQQGNGGEALKLCTAQIL